MNEHPGASIVLPEPPAAIHFVGIGGIGMSGLARMLAHQGYQISGSDAADSPIVDALRREGFPVVIGHDAANVGTPALVVATAAAPPSNPELAVARERGIPVVKRAAVLGLLSSNRDCIAVAGTHGKSTTSGMLAYALERAGESPSFAVGAVVNQFGTNARAGDGSLFVAEADEYDYSFLWLSPLVAIVTNIEHDHPDLFPTLEAVEDAYDRFTRRIRPGGALVISADDPGCRALRARVGRDSFRVITFGLTPGADWTLERVAGRDLFRGPSGEVLRLRMRVPGLHNRLNAAAAFAAAQAAGVDPRKLVTGIEDFGGVGRRFELRGEEAGITVIDDYAHHPTEIRATILAARERYPAGRIWAIFQPHTYSRTRELLDDFAAALELADRVVLTPIYAARETDTLGVSSHDIAQRITVRDALTVDSLAVVSDVVADQAELGDVVLVLGAGDVWKVSSEILRRLRERVA